MAVKFQRQSAAREPQGAVRRLVWRSEKTRTGRRSARHQSERLSAAESRRLDDALADEVATMTSEQLSDEAALFLVARRFVHQSLASRAPTLSRILNTARAGVIDSFMVRWDPLPERETRLLAAIAACAIGEPFNYLTQNGGALIMPIQPTEDAGNNTQTTRDEFEDHSDDAFVERDYRAEFILLTGVFNPSKTKTHYCSISDAATSLSEKAKAVLFEPRFSVRAPTSFKLPMEVWSGPRAILSFALDGRLEIAWPSYATRLIYPDDRDAAEALVELRTAVRRHRFAVPIVAGCLFGLANCRGVHARDKIEFGDRLVLRNYVRSDLAALRSKTSEQGPVFDVRKTFGDGGSD